MSSDHVHSSLARPLGKGPAGESAAAIQPTESTNHKPRMRPMPAAPPSIRSLIAWTTGCAIYFSLMRLLSPGRVSDRGTIMLVAQSFSSGAAIAAVMMAMLELMRRTARLRSPGEWLLLASGVNLLAQMALTSTPVDALVGNRMAIGVVLLGWMLLVPMLSRRTPTLWRVCFLLLVLIHTVPLLVIMLNTIMAGSLGGVGEWLRLWWVRAGATSLVLATAAAIDWRRGERRDWLHWVGLTAWWWDALVRAVFQWGL